MKQWELALFRHLQEHNVQHPNTYVSVNAFLATFGLRNAELRQRLNYYGRHQYLDGTSAALRISEHDAQGFGITYDGSGGDLQLRINPEGEQLLADLEKQAQSLRLGKREWRAVVIVGVLTLFSAIAEVWQLGISLTDPPVQGTPAPQDQEVGRSATPGASDGKSVPVVIHVTTIAETDTIRDTVYVHLTIPVFHPSDRTEP